MIAEQAPKMSAYVPPGELYLSLLLVIDIFEESLKKTIDTPSDDSLKLCVLTKGLILGANLQVFIKFLLVDDHNSVMDLISKIAVDYQQLAAQFCIPPYKVKEIKHNNRDEAWTCLNAVLGEWLKWNMDKKAEELKVKPNKRWLVEAVKIIDPEIGEDIEQSK